MKFFLVDNGSLRAESVLNLRRVARELSGATGLPVLPSSLLHSSKVPAEELEGEAAVNLERRLRLFLESGERAFTVIPFFFGPTGAITDYLPGRIAHRREKHGDFRIERAPFLCEGKGIARILVSRIEETILRHNLFRPRVVLVDHGSPLREVTRVRDRTAAEVAEILGETVACLSPASMERREGGEYAFNEPLLEKLLERPGWNTGPVVVAMMFLSPGRHAGPGGDIDTICRTAEARNPGLRTYMTGLVGDHPAIIDVLARRLSQPRVEL